MHIKEIIQSRRFTIALMVLAELILLAIIFQAGMFVGFHKARFSYAWGENYHRVFGGPKRGFMQDFTGRDFTDSHGTVGKVVQIDGNTLIIKGQNEVEKAIIVTPHTVIKKGQADSTLSDIHTEDQVVVIGSPQDQGQIEAKVIRIFTSATRSPEFTKPLPAHNAPSTKY